jgi:hypothetical protein
VNDRREHRGVDCGERLDAQVRGRHQARRHRLAAVLRQPDPGALGADQDPVGTLRMPRQGQDREPGVGGATEAAPAVDRDVQTGDRSGQDALR